MSRSRTDITRQRILESAYALFSEKGVEKTTTKEIAVTAGIAELTLFRHFKNKANLLHAVMMKYSPAAYIEDLIEGLEELPLKEGLLKLTNVLVDHFEKNKKIITIILAEPCLSDEFKNVKTPIQNKIIGHIAEYFRQKIKPEKLPVDFSMEEMVMGYLWSIIGTMLYFQSEKMGTVKISSQKLCHCYYKMFVAALD